MKLRFVAAFSWFDVCFLAIAPLMTNEPGVMCKDPCLSMGQANLRSASIERCI